MSITRVILLCGLLLLATGSTSAELVPGDANNDGTGNISDAVYIIQYVFAGGAAPLNQSCADVSGDCLVNVSDAVILIGYIFAGNPTFLERGCLHQQFNPGCSPTAEQKSDAGKQAADYELGYMYAEVLGNDLYIHHMAAEYQCCLGYLVEFEIDNYFNITATESDTGEECDCSCDFNLTSVLNELEDGEYVVTLIGIYGDEIGVDTVVVEGGFGLTEYHDSGCLEMTATFDPPDIEYLYSDGVLDFAHYDAFYNCGSIFMVQFEQAGDTLRFYELNANEDCAYCMCYFEITATVIGIEAGSYIAEVWGRDCLSPLTLVDRREITLD